MVAALAMMQMYLVQRQQEAGVAAAAPLPQHASTRGSVHMARVMALKEVQPIACKDGLQDVDTDSASDSGSEHSCSEAGSGCEEPPASFADVHMALGERELAAQAMQMQAYAACMHPDSSCLRAHCDRCLR